MFGEFVAGIACCAIHMRGSGRAARRLVAPEALNDVVAFEREAQFGLACQVT